MPPNPTPEQVREIAEGLTAPMRNALDRLALAMVWTDGRSRKALVRRRLAKEHGTVTDALIGTCMIATITPLGSKVRAHLEGREP